MVTCHVPPLSNFPEPSYMPPPLSLRFETVRIAAIPIAGMAGMKNVTVTWAPETGLPLLSVSLTRKVSSPLCGGEGTVVNSALACAKFTTVPSPPHKGEDTFRVKLTESNGSPVSGAQVTVTFFMPAMPAMGMAAMRTVSNLSDKGGGMYEGSGKLESGGTWQVTIVAQKSGQTLVSKQLTVSAEGGM